MAGKPANFQMLWVSKMLQKKSILHIFILSFIFLLCCKGKQEYSFSQNQTKMGSAGCDSLSNDEINLLQNGDIIMRHGRGAISLSITAKLNEKYKLSHCGILNIDGDSISVIHTLSIIVSHSNGVQIATLKEFFADTYENSLVVVRLKNTNNNKITDRAKYYLAKKIPFDDNFNINDTTKFFCNQLVSHILETEYGINLIDTATSDQLQNMRFSRFLDTSKFEIIINHQNK